MLGGGSAGFITAINVKARNPDIAIAVIRSPNIAIIGVGESTIHTVPKYQRDYQPAPKELQLAQEIKDAHRKLTRDALTSEEALAVVRAANWQWPAEVFKP